MAALCQKPVKTFGDMKLYYAPQRDTRTDVMVDTKTNRWHDNETGWSGDIIDLAA